MFLFKTVEICKFRGSLGRMALRARLGFGERWRRRELSLMGAPGEGRRSLWKYSPGTGDRGACREAHSGRVDTVLRSEFMVAPGES